MRGVVSATLAIAAVAAAAAFGQGWGLVGHAASAPTSPRVLGPDPAAVERHLASLGVPSSRLPASAVRPQQRRGPLDPHEFYFTRAIYSEGGRGFFRGGGGSWATDYPKADEQFMTVLDRLVEVDLYGESNAVRLDNPELRRFPFLYMLEVGNMRMTDEELEGLRSYLEAGGFLVVDDFWGTYEWLNFEQEMARLFPERPIVDLPFEHPVFQMVYPIDTIVQVPSITNITYNHQTWERDGYVPAVKGIFHENGRLMVAINWNTDLGDAWEWAENPYYPLQYSTYAFEIGVNMIVYAMSH